MTCSKTLLAFTIGLILTLIAPVRPTLAHEGQPLAPETLWSDWHWEPAILLSLAISGGLYVRGQRVFARRVAQSRSASRLKRRLARRSFAFYLGLVILALALLSPLDGLSSALFAAHMGQHMLIILVAAPLLVLGDPLPCWLLALGVERRRGLGQWWNKATGLRRVWSGVTHPIPAWGLHAIAIWGWHVPVAYEAALNSQPVHSLEHGSFLVTALLFWWAVIPSIQFSRRLEPGLSIIYLFTMMLQSGVLGVLITFSPLPWYAGYSQTAPAWGLTALEDQQLAGVLMWIPAGVIYAAAALTLFMTWLGEIERRANAALPSSDIQSAAVYVGK